MSADSIAQRRLMGMSYAYKKGELDLETLDPDFQNKIKELADSMSLKDLKDFSSTEEDELPYKAVSENHYIKDFTSFINEGNNNDELSQTELIALLYLLNTTIKNIEQIDAIRKENPYLFDSDYKEMYKELWIIKKDVTKRINNSDVSLLKSKYGNQFTLSEGIVGEDDEDYLDDDFHKTLLNVINDTESHLREFKYLKSINPEEYGDMKYVELVKAMILVKQKAEQRLHKSGNARLKYKFGLGKMELNEFWKFNKNNEIIDNEETTQEKRKKDLIYSLIEKKLNIQLKDNIYELDKYDDFIFILCNMAITYYESISKPRDLFNSDYEEYIILFNDFKTVLKKKYQIDLDKEFGYEIIMGTI